MTDKRSARGTSYRLRVLQYGRQYRKWAVPIPYSKDKLIFLPLTFNNQQLASFIFLYDINTLEFTPLVEYPTYFNPISLNLAFRKKNYDLFILEYQTDGAENLYKVNLKNGTWTPLYDKIWLKTGICNGRTTTFDEINRIYVANNILNVIGPHCIDRDADDDNSNNNSYQIFNHHTFDETINEFVEHNMIKRSISTQGATTDLTPIINREYIQDAVILNKNAMGHVKNPNAYIIPSNLFRISNRILEYVPNLPTMRKFTFSSRTANPHQFTSFDQENGIISLREGPLLSFGQVMKRNDNIIYFCMYIIYLSVNKIEKAVRKYHQAEYKEFYGPSFKTILLEDQDHEKQVCSAYINGLERKECQNVNHLPVTLFAIINAYYCNDSIIMIYTNQKENEFPGVIFKVDELMYGGYDTKSQLFADTNQD